MKITIGMFEIRLQVQHLYTWVMGKSKYNNIHKRYPLLIFIDLNEETSKPPRE